MRRDGIEVYSQERYMICTGNTLGDLPIVDAQAYLDNMQLQMRSATPIKTTLEEVEERYSDAEIFEKASNAANADKFLKLASGDFSDYPSQSEADLALMSIIAFYSDANEQCRRIFRCSNLGQRAKATKDDKYLNKTLMLIRGRDDAEQKNAEYGGLISSALLNSYDLRNFQASTINKNSLDSEGDLTLAGLAGDSGFEWKSPSNIETKTPPVQALSPELIPEPFLFWLVDVSHRMQTAPDFATVSVIVVIASIIGAGCSIKPKKHDDWEVIPNLWGAVIAPPSKKKTPTMSEATALLDRIQAEYGKEFERNKSGADVDEIANQAILDDVKAKLKNAAKNGCESFQDLKAEYINLTENSEQEPTRRMFKANETSVQSMTVLQSKNPRGILVFRDELTGLLAKWETEAGQEERTYYLQGWNGNGSYTDDKIGRGLTECKQICISILGGIQPDKLRRYLYQAMNGFNDGLMQRLQLAVWPDIPKEWTYIDEPVIKAYKERAYNIMRSLAEMDFIQHGAIKSEYDDRPYFRFDDAGQAIFIEWFTELETKKIPEEENPLMVEHLSKFGKLMPSLALIFHCIDIADGKADGQVSAKGAQLAVEWCKYLESHARRIYAMAASPEHETAVRLASKIKSKSLSNPFTTKIVYDKGWHGLKIKKEVEAACSILIEENWLRVQEKPRLVVGGRPPLPHYYINPALL